MTFYTGRLELQLILLVALMLRIRIPLWSSPSSMSLENLGGDLLHILILRIPRFTGARRANEE